MDAEILSVSALSAGYGSKVIIRGIDLALKGGDILGLLGAMVPANRPC